MEGIVKWYNTQKGYGFIQGDDGNDYFVHHNAITRGAFIRENDRVSFEPAETDRGKQAKNVTLLQKGSEAKGKDEEEEYQEGEAEEEETEEEPEEVEEEEEKEKEEEY